MPLSDALPLVGGALCGPAPVCAVRRPAPAKRRKTMAMAMNFVFFMVPPFSDNRSHFAAPILCAMLKQLLILPHACPPSVARRFEPSAVLGASSVRRGGANTGRKLWCEDEQRFPFGTPREPQGGLRRVPMRSGRDSECRAPAWR